MLSHVQLFATPWNAACQASLSMGFSRQEYWSGLSFLSPGDLPNLGIEPGSPELQADSLPSEPPGNPQGGNRGLEFSRKRKGQTSFFFFFSTFLSLSHIKDFFSLSQELMITQQTTQFKLCTKDYITMYPA